MKRKPTSPQAEALALAVRLLGATLPRDSISVSVHSASPEALELLRSLGAVTTTSAAGDLRIVRARVGDIEITGYEDIRPSAAEVSR